MPPQFDFAGSENVKSVDRAVAGAAAALPTERRQLDRLQRRRRLSAAGRATGRSRPVTLRLKLDYGVCEKLCIPASGKAELQLTGGASSEDTALTEAEMTRAEAGRARCSRAAFGPAARREVTASRQRGDRRRDRARRGPSRALRRRARRRNGRCPCPSRSKMDRTGTRRFAFASMACRPAPARRRDDRRSPSSPATTRSKSPSISTNAPRRAYDTVRTTTTTQERNIMPIKVGDRLPDAKFRVMTAEGPAGKPPTIFSRARKSRCLPCPAPSPAPATRNICRASCRMRRHQGQGHRHDRGDRGERRFGHGRLEEGDRRRRSRFSRRRQCAISPRLSI